MTLEKERLMVQLNSQIDHNPTSSSSIKSSISRTSDLKKLSEKNNEKTTETDFSSDLDKTLPKKNTFRIKKTVSIAIGTDDNKISKAPLKSLKKSQVAVSNGLRLGDLRSLDKEVPKDIGAINNILNARINDDKIEYEKFLNRLGLMRYYDQLWDIGVDSLEGLSKVTFIDYNALNIVAGMQLKIQRELKNIGITKEPQTKNASIGTEPSGETITTIKLTSTSENNQRKLNFGIKLSKLEQTHHDMSIGTDPIPDGSYMPLNVETENNQTVINNDSTRYKNKKARFEDSHTENIQKQQEPKPTFSFTSLGSEKWSNFEFEMPKLNDNIENESRRVFKENSLKKVGCYGCYKSLPEEDTLTHKKMPNKVAYILQSSFVPVSAWR